MSLTEAISFLIRYLLSIQSMNVNSITQNLTNNVNRQTDHGQALSHLSFETKTLLVTHLYIFTMVSYFLRWTLLKFFSSFPDEQSQQKVRQLDRITCAVINTSNEVKSPLLWEFWIYNFSLRILERVHGWKHCKYKEWVSFFSGFMGNKS